MGSSSHVDNKNKDILVLGKGPIQRLKHTLAEEKLYSIKSTEHNKIFCLSLHYNRANSYLFVNSTEVIEFKAKDSKTAKTPFFSWKHFKRLFCWWFEKDRIKWMCLWFNVDYDTIPSYNILDIRKCLMKKHDMK